MRFDSARLDKLPFQLHDFGFRGVSSTESAAIGGAAHLVNFMGSDTVAALVMARDVYKLSADTVAGFSIPASEHSTITSWGVGNELAAFENMLDKFPEGLVACVSDSENIWLYGLTVLSTAAIISLHLQWRPPKSRKHICLICSLGSLPRE